MDIATVLGLIGAFAAIIVSLFMGSSVAGFYDAPSIVIVVGGTISTALIMFPMSTLAATLKVVKKTFTTPKHDLVKNINEIVMLADKARKESLVALEKVSVPDPYMGRGVQLIADGTEEFLVRSVLEIEIDNLKSRHKHGQDVLKAMGTSAPAFGMIGTLIGLVQMLQNLDDPKSIGPAMAVALLTTFYGAVLANCLFLPMARKLEERSNEEVSCMEMTLEGIISILNGDHPMIIKEKLYSFLAPAKRKAMSQGR